MPIAPVPSTSARAGRHGWRPPTSRAWRRPRAQIEAGSARTPRRPRARGIATRCSAASATCSAAKPSSRVMPRSAYSPVRQASGAPSAQASQCSHERRTVAVTRSPRVKPSPSRSTTPSSSWPSTSGAPARAGTPKRPSEISRSVPQTPTSSVRTSTSPGRGRGAATSARPVLPGSPGVVTSACKAQAAVRPPSITRFVPVTNAAASEAR